MKYKVGDRVRIVDEWSPDCLQSSGGRMDHWLGQVMTVRSIECINGKNIYRMVEDIQEYNGAGWFWRDAAFVGLVDNIADNFDMENMLNILEF